MTRESAINYRRLQGRGSRRKGIFAGLTSRCSLYIAKDHILSLENHGFSEDYRRFYFSDIQAITTEKNRYWIAWGIISACIAVFFLAISFYFNNRIWRGIFLIFSTVSFLLMIINIFKGPTCRCRIITAVQEDDLPSLSRLRVAHKVINMLKFHINRAQGAPDAEGIRGDEDAAVVPPLQTTGSSGTTVDSVQQAGYVEGSEYRGESGL